MEIGSQSIIWSFDSYNIYVVVHGTDVARVQYEMEPLAAGV